MARYRLVEEDTGCCNLVIWDFLLTLAAAGFSVYYGFEKTIHPAWCFVIGLVAAILLVALMNIRILGKIIQILLSAFWSLVATSLATSLFHLDTLWQIVIFIVLTILFIGLHIVSAHEIGIGENAIGEVEPIIFESTSSPSANTSDVNREITQLTQRYESLGQEREHIMQRAVQMLQRQEHAALRQAFEENNRIWQEGSSKLETLAEKLEQQNQITEIYATIGVIRDCLDKMDAANKSVAQMLTRQLNIPSRRIPHRRILIPLPDVTLWKNWNNVIVNLLRVSTRIRRAAIHRACSISMRNMNGENGSSGLKK